MRPTRTTPAAGRLTRKRHPEIGSEFRRFALGRRVFYLRKDLAGQAAAIVAAMSHMKSPPASGNTLEGAGNRGGGFRLNLADGPEVFIRYARRGGLMSLIALDWYCGLRPRPLSELAVAAEAHRRGIAIAEPLGAAFQWILPGLYRGAFLTRALQGMTLWQFVQTDDDPLVRMHVGAQVRRVIDSAHQKGLFHADLNLHNIFVTTAGESFSVVLLDLDKARIDRESLPAPQRASNLNRLRRSIEKLDPERRFLNDALISSLTAN
jgi:3-deoxy-D-manno-octulosonic acid kinase